MSLNELTNEEVLFIYFSNKEQLDAYNNIFEDEGTESVIELGEAGRIIIFNKFTEDALAELADDPHYLSVKAMNAKLEPIASMIEDADPVLYRQVQQNFLNSIT